MVQSQLKDVVVNVPLIRKFDLCRFSPSVSFCGYLQFIDDNYLSAQGF